jgi:hypothetical protein
MTYDGVLTAVGLLNESHWTALHELLYAMRAMTAQSSSLSGIGLTTD